MIHRVLAIRPKPPLVIKPRPKVIPKRSEDNVVQPWLPSSSHLLEQAISSCDQNATRQPSDPPPASLLGQAGPSCEQIAARQPPRLPPEHLLKQASPSCDQTAPRQPSLPPPVHLLKQEGLSCDQQQQQVDDSLPDMLTDGSQEHVDDDKKDDDFEYITWLVSKKGAGKINKAWLFGRGYRLADQ